MFKGPLSLPQGNPKNVDFMREFNSQRCTLRALWTQREKTAGYHAFSSFSLWKSGCYLSWLLSVTLCSQLILSSISPLSLTYLSAVEISFWSTLHQSGMPLWHQQLWNSSGDSNAWRSSRTTGLQINQNLWGWGPDRDILLMLTKWSQCAPVLNATPPKLRCTCSSPGQLAKTWAQVLWLWDEAWESALLQSFWAVAMLLVWGPHCEQQETVEFRKNLVDGLRPFIPLSRWLVWDTTMNTIFLKHMIMALLPLKAIIKLLMPSSMKFQTLDDGFQVPLSSCCCPNTSFISSHSLQQTSPPSPEAWFL